MERCREAVRPRARAALKRVYELASRTGELRHFYVFGSFVSALMHPRDVDVMLVMAETFRLEHGPEEARALFFHADAQARYGATVFWARHGLLDEAAMQALLRAWQATREGKIRGILEIV